MKLDHIAIIASSENSIEFYKKLGFEVTKYQDRGYDKLYYLEGNGTTLEIYVDSTHPKRVDRPEALGLRHIALLVDSIDEVIKNLNVEAEPVRESNGQYYTFVRDPDNLPIEIRENIRK